MRKIKRFRIISTCLVFMLLAGCSRTNNKIPEESFTLDLGIEETIPEIQEGIDEFVQEHQDGEEEELRNENIAGSSNANYAKEDIARNATQATQTSRASSIETEETKNPNQSNSSPTTAGSANGNVTDAPRPTQEALPTIPVIPAPTIPSQAPETTASSASGSFAESEAKKVLNLVNEARRAQGLSELAWSSSLAASAMVRAEEIVISFSHTRPDGSNFGTVNSLARGENIAYGYRQMSTAQEVFQGWMNSQGHRENILRSSFGSLGVGCYVVNGTYYWVQLFGN